MRYQVRTFDVVAGEIAERSIEAESNDSARQFAEANGTAVLSVTAVKLRRAKLRPVSFDILLFCEEMRTLLSSGMSLVEAIDTLCTQDNQGSKRAVLVELRQHLLEGKPFSSALTLNRFGFPPLLIASIKASERTSRIEAALDEYIAYERVGKELVKKVVSAMIYPGLVIGFGAFVSLFMISYVVPRFAQVYEDFSQTVSLPTRILLMIGQFVSNYMALILFAALFGVAFGVALYRNGKLKLFVLRSARKFKFIQYYLRLFQLARIYQTMSMLLKGGYAVSDAIPLAQSLAFDADLHAQIECARKAIIEGRRLSTAFCEHGLTDHVTERLLRVGERSGEVSKIMEIVAHGYRQELTQFIDRATRVAEPLLLMAVGLLIGAIILLMYMPVFDLVGGI